MFWESQKLVFLIWVFLFNFQELVFFSVGFFWVFFMCVILCGFWYSSEILFFFHWRLQKFPYFLVYFYLAVSSLFLKIRLFLVIFCWVFFWEFLCCFFFSKINEQLANDHWARYSRYLCHSIIYRGILPSQAHVYFISYLNPKKVLRNVWVNIPPNGVQAYMFITAIRKLLLYLTHWRVSKPLASL